MPIYEYRCKSCGTVLEVMQKMSDPPRVHCDACDADALERIISQTSFVLKGSGWYVTDYKAKPAESKGDKKDAPPQAAKTDGAGAAKSGGESTSTPAPTASSGSTSGTTKEAK